MGRWDSLGRTNSAQQYWEAVGIENHMRRLATQADLKKRLIEMNRMGERISQ